MIATLFAAMRDFGVSRAHIFYVKQGTGGVPTTETASDDWFEKMRFAFARAREYGIACSFHNGPGWAGSGGPWIEPEYAAKEVTSSETDADFPAADDVPLVEPWTVSNYYHEVAACARLSRARAYASQSPRRRVRGDGGRQARRARPA